MFGSEKLKYIHNYWDSEYESIVHVFTSTIRNRNPRCKALQVSKNHLGGFLILERRGTDKNLTTISHFFWKIWTCSGDFGNSTFAHRVPKSPIFTSESVKNIICILGFWLCLNVYVQKIILMLIIKHTWQHKLPLRGDFGNSTFSRRVPKSPIFTPYRVTMSSVSLILAIA